MIEFYLIVRRRFIIIFSCNLTSFCTDINYPLINYSFAFNDRVKKGLSTCENEDSKTQLSFFIEPGNDRKKYRDYGRFMEITHFVRQQLERVSFLNRAEFTLTSMSIDVVIFLLLLPNYLHGQFVIFKNKKFDIIEVI